MSSGKNRRKRGKSQRPIRNPVQNKANSTQAVRSLYDAVVEGREYESLIASGVAKFDPILDIRRALVDIQNIRGRPLLIYAGNTVSTSAGPLTAITTDDDLPFIEMVQSVPDGIDAVDILLVTPGGMGPQVAQFVEAIRRRFSDVAFLLPHLAMSAGTIWALSGNEIIMDERAFIGPIDPQMPGKSGHFVPLQSIQVLIKIIQDRGAQALAAKKQPDWSDVHILQSLDPKEIGNSFSASNYAIQLASTYLYNHKFRDWDHHSDGRVVTDQEKQDRSQEIAQLLCKHDHWKAHSHGISREVAWKEIQLKITHPESIKGLLPALRRLWSIMYYTFQPTEIHKIFISENYSIIRQKQIA
ncbi:SDH family Clp fold serine proteinase [Candidatus Thiodiazotropha sp. LNASS1]|uniref:SDH family Clp fold serine proteinase n=1 Tax=Candidatus Thiodiazotropha sp. LNASS1 TaxID=3096260 RepID=UPI0034E0483E